MSEGSPFRALFFFSMPMVLGNLFQQLYNIVDTMVVGNFVGEYALAAVGTCSAVAFLFIAIAGGMGIGCSVIISQLFGAKQMTKMKLAIRTALIAMFGLSLALMAFGLLMNRQILAWMQTDAEVFEEAAAYLGIYCAGLPFLFMYNVLNSVFNALGESRIPLGFLLFSSLLNIGLDLYFVIEYQMGVAGVAWATLISQGASAVLSFLTLMWMLRRIGTEEKPGYFSGELLNMMCRVAVPSTIQQSIVSLGSVFIQSLVNSFGPTVMAGFAIANKIDQIAINPMVQIGNATSTFTAQNIGAGKPERVKQGLFSAYLITIGLGLLVAGTLYWFGDALIGAFAGENVSEAATVAAGSYLHVVSLFYVVFGCMNATNGVLRGSGDVGWFMFSTLTNFTLRVAAAYTLAPLLAEKAIWIAIPIGWSVAIVLSGCRVASGKWKEKKVI